MDAVSSGAGAACSSFFITLLCWNPAVIRSCCLGLALTGLLLGHGQPTCVGQVVLVPGLAAGGSRTMPRQTYDLAQVALATGSFTEALDLAEAEYKDCFKVGTSRWIDSAAAATMLGECCYELGRFREAVSHYDEAILHAVSHGDWLLDVRFPTQPLQANARPPRLWGQPPRPTIPAALPDRVPIRLGSSDPRSVIDNGGVLSTPVDYPLRPHEIMRSLAISLHRRGHLLGPLAKGGLSLEKASAWLQRNPVPAGHFSQAWIDVCLGIVYWSQGRNDQALPLLKRGLLAEAQFDHPLTPWALLTSGRIMLAEQQWPEAATVFQAAAYSAAAQADARALEEACRWLVAACLAGDAGLPPMLTAAADWAGDTLPSFSARLRILAAEALAEAGDRQAAARLLGEVDQRLLRGDLGQGWCGGHAAYAAALIDYCNGNRAAGDPKLAKALGLARRRSPRLFQTHLLTEAVAAGQSGLSDREASALFENLLGDPEPALVRTDPLEALAVMSTNQAASFEIWLGVAAAIQKTSSRGDEAWLDVTEATRRNRWLTDRDLGGRRDGLLHVLTRPATEDAATARKAILAEAPDVATTLAELEACRDQLSRDMQATTKTDPPAETDPGGPEQWQRYATAAESLGMRIDQLAAGRSIIPLTFPPLLPTATIRDRLAPRQRLLSFNWTESGLVGSLEAPKQAAVWRVKQPGAVSNTMASLAKSLCLYHAIKPVSTDRLLSGGWQQHARQLADLLFEGSGVSLTRHDDFDELVIVPDGLLWYLPFELLPVEADDSLRLRDVCRLRYCPTRSLAVTARRPATAQPFTAIYDGLAYRGDPPERTAETLARLTANLENAISLSPTARKIPVALPASLADTLAVFDDLAPRATSSGQPLVAAVAGHPGMSLPDWLRPPAKAPRCVLLTGLQTQVANGLSRVSGRAGHDLFTTAMDLVAAGAETLVLSRWNVGGRVSINLGLEFLRDQPIDSSTGSPPSAAERWQRAVDLVTNEQPDFDREPRLQVKGSAVLPDAQHPFFWSGFALIDCGVIPHDAADPPAEAAE